MDGKTANRINSEKKDLPKTETNNGQWKPFQDIRFFLFVSMMVVLTIIASFTHLTAAMRTLERRFGLKSAETGLLIAMNDIINLTLALFIGYFGKKVNKPRLQGILSFVGGVGVLLFALPNFLYPMEEDVTSSTNDNQTQQRNQLCSPGSTSPPCTVSSSQESNNNAYTIFTIAAALTGLGNVGFTILIVAYIDENTTKVQSPVYLAFSNAAYPVGPLLGFGLAALFLDLPENLKDSPVPSSDPSFIGCWWMPFVIYGSISILFSIPLLFFPKHMKQFYDAKLERAKNGKAKESPSKTKDEKKSLMENLKDVWHSYWKVLKNGTFVTLSVSGTCGLFMIVSILIQMTKYLQLQFHISPSRASLLVGLSGSVLNISGALLSGYLMKRYKIQKKGAARIMLVFFCVITVSIGSMLPWKCAQPQAVLNNKPCNEACSCSMETTQPICEDNKLLYATPCHAGCVNPPENQTYIGCSCSEDGSSLTPGLCTPDGCDAYIPHIALFPVFSFAAGVSRLAGLSLQLRVVDQELRSPALGFASFLYNAFVFIPGPIIMGRLFDSTCLLWKTSCGEEENCLSYNMDRYREYMHGVSVSMMILGTLLAVLLNVLVVRKVNREDEEASTTTLTDAGHVNDGMTNDKEDATSIRSWNTKF